MANGSSNVWQWLKDSRTYIAVVSVVVGGLLTNYVKPGIMLSHRLSDLEMWRLEQSSGFNEVRWGQRWVICRIEFADALARGRAQEGDAVGNMALGTSEVSGCEWIRTQAPGIFSRTITSPLK